MSDRLSVAFEKLTDWVLARGDSNLNQIEGLYEADIDDHWRVQINAHAETIDAVPPYHASVTYDGWPALLMSPTGGTSLLGRDGWRAEDAFIEALSSGGEEPNEAT